MASMMPGMPQLGAGTNPASEQKKSEEDIPDVPIEHLDYGYIDGCSDVNELKDILAVLQSGKEGRWHQLEKHCEDKMVKLLPPKERRLYVAQRTEPSFEEKDAAASELNDFIKSINGKDEKLKFSKGANSSTHDRSEDKDESLIFDDTSETPTSSEPFGQTSIYPPVRGTTNTNPANDDPASRITRRSPAEVARDEAAREKAKAGRLSGYDFRAWDKFDVDAELNRIDAEEDRLRKAKEAEIAAKQAAIDERKRLSEKAKRRNGLPAEIPKLSSEQREFFSNREKEKGNECFKAGEFEDALRFYNKCIELLPEDSSDPRPFSNRAMAFLKLEKFEQAERDCDRALKLDQSCIKALGRRGIARHRRGKYLDAIDDFEEVLHREPTNSKMSALLAESRKQYNAVGGIGADRPGAPARSSQKTETFKKLIIMEDSDSDSDSEEEEGDAETPLETTEESKEELKEQPHDETGKVVGAVSGDTSKNPEPEMPHPSGAIVEPTLDWVQAKRLGADHFKKGEFARALDFFGQAVAALEGAQEQAEHLCNCLGNMAVCYKELGRWNDVVLTSNKVLSLAPDNVKALFRRGLAYEALCQFDKGLDDMCAVLRIDPNRTEAGDKIAKFMGYINDPSSAPNPPQVQSELHVTRGLVAQSQAPAAPVAPSASSLEQQKAPQQVMKREDSVPDTAESLKVEGNALFSQGKFESALRKYAECLELDNSNVSARANRAMAFLKIERFQECIDECSLGLSSTNDDAHAIRTKLYFRRAEALNRIGKMMAALDDLEKAAELEPLNKRVKQSMADTRREIEKEQRRKEQAARNAKQQALVEEQRALAEKAKQKIADKLKSEPFKVPKTSYEFSTQWRAMPSTSAKAAFLKNISAAQYKKLFSVELPEDMLLEIMQVVDSCIVSDDRAGAVPILTGLAGAKGFQSAALFLSSSQKEMISTIIAKLQDDTLTALWKL